MTKQQQLERERKGLNTMLKRAKAEQQAPAKKAPGSKKAAAAQQRVKKAAAGKKDGGESDSDEFDMIEESSVPEPPYQYEVHLKRRKIYFHVQLHKIPHMYVDVSQSTDTRVVVDTTRYSKKYRLEHDLDGMRVDSKNGEFAFDGKVLNITLDIVGDVPAEETERINKIIQSVKDGRKLRFERGVDADTGLEQRVKTRVLSLTEQRTAVREEKREKRLAAEAAQKAEIKAARRRAGGWDDAAVKEERIAFKPSAPKRKQFVDDDAAAAAIASSVADRTRSKIVQQQEKQRVQAKLQSQRDASRLKAGAKKREASLSSFLAIVNKKKADVAAAASAAATSPLPKTAKAGAKSVSFA